ncbi:hypothetical protein APA_5317 [Pseudanabaena sp. lw0831]|nr:hypothetical protein APA_5317 [Pseudanabaena sp. lw0831]
MSASLPCHIGSSMRFHAEMIPLLIDGFAGVDVLGEGESFIQDLS